MHRSLRAVMNTYTPSQCQQKESFVSFQRIQHMFFVRGRMPLKKKKEKIRCAFLEVARGSLV